jgi:hypothetical protein
MGYLEELIQQDIPTERIAAHMRDLNTPGVGVTGPLPQYQDFGSRASGGAGTIADPILRANMARLNAAAMVEQATNQRKQYEQDRLIKFMSALDKMDPDLQRAVSERYGLVPKGQMRDVGSSKLREQMRLARYKHELEAPETRQRLALLRQNQESLMANRRDRSALNTTRARIRETHNLVKGLLGDVPANSPRRQQLERVLQDLMEEAMGLGIDEAEGAESSSQSRSQSQPKGPRKGRTRGGVSYTVE